MNLEVVVAATRPAELARLRSALDPSVPVIVVDGRGRSPAEARNHGWRQSRAEWVVFLDDDVVPTDGWLAALERDLRDAPADLAGSQGVVEVPLPPDRPPTDWERHVRGLATAAWVTADMAYRRSVLAELGGFDEGFRRAYREDSDLAVRTLRAGYALRRGSRRTVHPVGAASWRTSLTRQRGNADDARMRAKHGHDWRTAAGAPRGRLRRHALVAGLGCLAVAAGASGRPRVARAAAVGWLAGTAELARARIQPGPRTAKELTTMLVTSALLPGAATAWSLAGRARTWRLRTARRAVDAVLFDRDGTLVVDVPYNGDPEQVVAVEDARAAVARCRSAGLRVGVVTNQSGVGRGLLTLREVSAVNRAVDRLVGPFDVWIVCPHAPDAGCGCRKPAPGGVRMAASLLGVRPEQCVLVGDIGTDLEAARTAGARSVLVPNAVTRRSEIDAASHVAPSLCAAVETVLGGRA